MGNFSQAESDGSFLQFWIDACGEGFTPAQDVDWDEQKEQAAQKQLQLLNHNIGKYNESPNSLETVTVVSPLSSTLVVRASNLDAQNSHLDNSGAAQARLNLGVRAKSQLRCLIVYVFMGPLETRPLVV